MRGCFYLENRKGQEHLMRAFRLCKEIAKEHEIVLLTNVGSEKLKMALPANMKEVIVTPSILEGQKFNKEQRISEIKERRKIIHSVTHKPFDFLITDLFPFGSKALKIEVLDLIAEVKKQNPKALIFSSFSGRRRHGNPDGSLDEQADEATKELIEAHYDHLFVHTDPKVLPLEEVFSFASTFKERLTYTGFVGEEGNPTELPKEKEILVIGKRTFVGNSWLKMFANIGKRFPKRDWNITLVEDANKKQYPSRDLMAAVGRGAIDVIPFSAEVEKKIKQAALVCAVDEEFLIDCYLAKKFCLQLIVPYDHPEFRLLPKWEEMGLARRVRMEECSPQGLLWLFTQALQTPFPQPPPKIMLGGAKNMLEEINKRLKR